MLSNTMLLNINRNMGGINRLYNQISTAKKIQVPSDDPITSARALKFRSNVSDNAQYQRNVSQGMAWMNVTEGAYNNVIDIIKSIKDRCLEAANGTLEAADRQAVAAQLAQLAKQLGTEMNVSYAGRYVFSGFRTNEPPMFDVQTDKSYRVTQDFGAYDIERTRFYQKLSADGVPETGRTDMIKLAYSLPSQAQNLILVDGAGNTITATPTSASAPDAYDSESLASGSANLITETGEIVLSSLDSPNITSLSVTYDKTGFMPGEPNPIVYFKCSELDSLGAVIKTYNMDGHDIMYEFSANTDLKINSLGYSTFTDKLYAELRNLGLLMENIPLSSQRQLQDKYRALGYAGAELEDAANRQMAEEKAVLSTVLHDRFNNMLSVCDSHLAIISREHTDLGARMNRLELVLTRLEQDESSYKELMSDNEDVDMMEAIMLKSSAEAAYQASLKAGANIVQMTLSNFI
jgi:flagellar hook-associated protein 3 FlgL